MKKKVFIAAHYLEIGGAEISLIGLLNTLDYSKVDVTLFLYQKKGELLSFVPKEVNILDEIPAFSLIESPLKETIKKGYWGLTYARLIAKLKYRSWAKKNNPPNIEGYYQYLDNEIMRFLPNLFELGDFDLAINFIGMRNVIPMKVKAKKCITWIHTDLQFCELNVPLELKSWDRYNHIISISPKVTDTFLTKFPSLKSKIIEIENILPFVYVKSRSSFQHVDAEFNKSDKEICLLSVGRYCNQKNYDNVPYICKRLIEKGLMIKWYIIGYGSDEALIRKKIIESGMERNVILLGKRQNPYPYMKNCDVYVQPSRFEGKSVTVREAQMLGKPVIITNFNTASSQVRHGYDGMIVPLENDACADAIAEILKNKELLIELSANCRREDFSNESEVNKIYSLL